MDNYIFRSKIPGNYVTVVENNKKSRANIRQMNQILKLSNFRLVPQGRGPNSTRLQSYWSKNVYLNAPLCKAPLMAIYLQSTDGSRNWDNRRVWQKVRKHDHPIFLVQKVNEIFSPYIVF